MNAEVGQVETLLAGVPAERRPRHIAIIMDGNGRWAQRRGWPRIEGHRQGVSSVRDVVETAGRAGVRYLTLYCLSSENWKRPRQELDFLMSLLQQFVIEQRRSLLEQGVRLRMIGRRDGLPADVLADLDQTIEMSAANDRLELLLAINYGGRGEIVDAARALARRVAAGELRPEDIDEARLDAELYTAGTPDPDLLIRTAGELRVSNFLLWQVSYAELWVTDLCWPDFRGLELTRAIVDFAARTRRFGGLNG